LRVYHVARETGYTNRVLLQMMHARGVDLPSHMGPLTDAETAVLNEVVTALKAGNPVATSAPAAAPAARPAPGRPVISAVVGTLDTSTTSTTSAEDARNKKVKGRIEEEPRKVTPPPRKQRRARDDKSIELTQELEEEGIAEVLAPEPEPTVAPKPGIPAPMPTRPIPGVPQGGRGMSRLDQRRTPRTLTRQRRRGRQAPTLSTGAIPVQVPISIKDFSQAVSVRANFIIKSLMQSGSMVNINSMLDEDTVRVLALEFSRDIEVKHPRPPAEQILDDLEPDIRDETRLEPRPPVVAVLGHVDHGKTSLLDAIRRTDVAAGEAGGITQHIGAYQVTNEDGRVVTFLDTPGHEAFTAMRARGANVADICVLVVAADDGVMPQTEEAINHARAADVPIVVALNKIDKPNANKDRVLNQLATLGLAWEKWGGDTIIEPVSATTGEGIKHLVELLSLQADLLQLGADPHRRAVGTVLEASKHMGRGVLATLLVAEGTLRVGDIVLAGGCYGRIRSISTEKGEDLDEAPPSSPVQVTGFSEVPEASARFYVLDDLSTAKTIAENRTRSDRAADRSERPQITLENVFSHAAAGDRREVRIILKTDVKGSEEALVKKLSELDTEEVFCRVLHSAVGAISESDVKLAVASRAVILGFNVLTEASSAAMAEREGVQIRTYRIIYEVLDDLKKAMEGLLEPEKKEEVLGHATVKQVFSISRVGTIAGCAVTDGLLRRSGTFRLYRDGRLVVPSARLANLKRFKDDVREVKQGFECGLKIENFDDIKVGDVLECFEVIEVARFLA
jgi:translation initiation factor IF-2